MSRVRAVACATASFVCLVDLSSAARAQGPGEATALPEVVVTADRRPEPIAQTGSAISVLTREEIRTFNPASLVDALRNVPGLDVTETGGPGATTSVRLRGANTGQTLVLIDGIRINDPSGASGDFDFSNLLPTAIDRIEVLRGPQSALYGSDAIGGVVNIITRQGSGPPRFELRQEAGSYGTLSTNATAFGSTGPWSYAFSGGGQRASGFSRFGYRIGRLEGRYGRFEADGFSRFGGFGRVGYDAGEGVKLEIGGLSTYTHAEYDSALTGTGILPDTPSRSDRVMSQIWARGTVEQGPLLHSLKVYLNETDRTFRDVSLRTTGATVSDARSEFRGDRLGTEYQGDLSLERFGTFTFGGRLEEEKATTYSTALLPRTGPRTLTFDGQQDSRSVFALYRLPVGDRVILTAGGRHDETGAVEFNTWRATGVFLLPETGTKLRATGGTGGKAPTLYQLFAPTFGTPGLQPERSIGWDAGIDQELFGGRVSASLTVFGNKFDNLIEFNGAVPQNNYYNVTRAETSGVELEGRVDIVPGIVRLTGAYTYLQSKNELTGLTLARRPADVGRVGLPVFLTPDWTVEPRLTLVSERFSGANETLRLAPYARLDIYTDYRVNDTIRVFARVENATNARYGEVYNYGTTGPAGYAGVNITW